MAGNSFYYGDNLERAAIDCPPFRHTSQTVKKAPEAGQVHEQATPALDE